MNRRTLAIATLMGALVGAVIGSAVVLTPTAIGGGATLSNVQKCVEGNHVQQEIAVTELPDSEENGTVSVQITYDVNASVSRLAVTPIGTVVEISGFNRSDDQLTATTPSDRQLSYTTVLSLPPDQDSRLPQYEEDQWVLFNPPTFRAHWAADGTHYCADAADGGLPFGEHDADLATVGTQTMLFATTEPVTTETRTLSDGSRITLVVPDDSGVAPADDVGESDRILDRYGRLSHSFDVGCNRNMTMFALPEQQPLGAGYAISNGGTTSVWVHENDRVVGPQSTWVHEYIHGRQCMGLSDDMEWFTEASANYFRTYYAHEFDDEDGGSFESLHGVGSESSVLANQSTWDSAFVPYYKGARALVYVDAELRSHSDKTLVDAFAWMNAHDGRVTYKDFRGYVVEHTDEEVGEQLDAYVLEESTIPTTEEQTRVIHGENGSLRRLEPPRGGNQEYDQ